jgi:hypothetical protein
MSDSVPPTRRMRSIGGAILETNIEVWGRCKKGVKEDPILEILICIDKLRSCAEHPISSGRETRKGPSGLMLELEH